MINGTQTDDISHGFQDRFLKEPNCLRCLRTKLEAIGVVVFVKDQDSWLLNAFQGDVPEDVAEVMFYGMIKLGVPEKIFAQGRDFVLSDNAQIQEMFPQVETFRDTSLIAARVAYGEFKGVRVAWREQSRPYSEKDLGTVNCVGECPEACL